MVRPGLHSLTQAEEHSHASANARPRRNRGKGREQIFPAGANRLEFWELHTQVIKGVTGASAPGPVVVTGSAHPSRGATTPPLKTQPSGSCLLAMQVTGLENLRLGVLIFVTSD